MLAKDKKVINSQFLNIPQELKDIPKWVVWKAIKGKNGRISKVPHDLQGRYRKSYKEPFTYEQVLAAYNNGAVDGIGFALEGSGYMCLDFDGTDLNDIPQQLRTLENHTYVEISPSGNGLHVWFKGNYPGEKGNQGKSIRYTKKEGYKTEWFYDTGFLTMTGNTVNNIGIDDQQMLIDHLFDMTESENDNKKSPNSKVNDEFTRRSDDEFVLRQALKNKQTYSLFHNGDTTKYGNDSSKADFALCKDLAKVTDDSEQIERLFMSSALYRQPPEKHATYPARTIAKAMLEVATEKENVFSISISQNNDTTHNNNWKQKLHVTEDGKKYLNSRRNIQLILSNDERIKNIGRTNVFADQKEIYKTPPWRKKDDVNTLWSDSDEEQLRIYIDVNYGISSDAKVSDCLGEMFYKNSYHPIKDYLDGLTWDGTSRVDSLFIDYLGSQDYKYTRSVTRKMLVGAVARIFEPGTKFDTALILIGKQGIGKSFVLSKLGKEWFNESVHSFKGDDALMKLRDSWIIELAELSAMKSSEVEEAKGFISAVQDTYRPKYAKNVQRFPRQCVFFGSTNNHEFLKDKTGNRRFWPVAVDDTKRTLNPFEQLTDDVVDQLWAEAVQLYKQGEPLHLEDEEVANEAMRLQGLHTSDDGMTGIIEEYIKRHSIDKICAREVWHECLMKDVEPKGYEISDINQILRNLEYTEPLKSTFGKFGQQRGFKINK